MIRRRLGTALLAGSCAVLVGCGDSAAHATVGINPKPTASEGSSTIKGPSISARMTCSEVEIQNAIALTLGLSGAPKRSSQWVNPVYTCTYHLHEGPLRLMVTEFGSDAAAVHDFEQMKSTYLTGKVPVQTLQSFTVPAFLASDDVVLTVKDNKILRVDATELPKTLGPAHRARRDLIYLVTSAILRCWSGD